jgi:hypothetical protein
LIGALGAAADHTVNTSMSECSSRKKRGFNFRENGLWIGGGRRELTTSSASLQRKISRRFASLSCGEGIGWPGSGVTEAGHRIKRRAISMSDEKTAQSPHRG